MHVWKKNTRGTGQQLLSCCFVGLGKFANNKIFLCFCLPHYCDVVFVFMKSMDSSLSFWNNYHGDGQY